MSTIPVIFLAFANNEQAHLSLLKQESSSIYQVLDYWDSREFVKVVREESVQVKEVFQMLSRYENRLAIFHYAGHASGEGLYLEDDEVYAGGMAQLLGQQENLVLVFLNGCSTRGQVQMLLDAGVKAVIATSVPIGDNRAQFFAETFYQALAHRRTIKRAFHFATAALKAKYSDAPAMNLVRGLHFPDAEETPEREIEWGLYLRPESEKAVLDWRLPTYRSTGLQEQMVRYLHDHSQANKYLVTVLDAMCRFNKDIYTQLVEVVDGQEVKKDTADFMELIIRNLPWVIGSQIQLLLQKKRLDTGRLEQLISIYIATSQLLYYIVLSNIWEEQNKGKFKAADDFLAENEMSPERFASFDYLSKVIDLYQALEDQESFIFMPELEAFTDLLQEDSFEKKAWNYLEGLRKQWPSFPPAEVETSCLRAEQALTVLLKSVAFLADYRMLTIRDIQIDNPRFSTVSYMMELGRLNAIVDTGLSLYQDESRRRKTTYTNRNSIILVQQENDLGYSLNLSPFIIDKNAFLNHEAIDPYVFVYEKEGHYHYLAARHSIFSALQNNTGTDLIHTGLSHEDFHEGRNITQTQKADDDFFGALFAEPATTSKRTPVFDLLEAQFEHFKSSFTSIKS